MVINLHTSSNVKVNYDTLNEVYIVTEADGTTTCSSAEILLHQYQFKGDVNDHRARKFSVREMIDSAVVSTINYHQNQVELFKDVVL